MQGNHDITGSGTSFRVFYEIEVEVGPDGGRRRISPWHDIPLLAGIDFNGDPLFHFVCEIPRGSARKFEINKARKHNPIVQDVQCTGNTAMAGEPPRQGSCSPRNYTFPSASPASPANYGALTQTWEDPEALDSHTGFGGDNDPIDVLQLSSRPCVVGEVIVVRVVGALAMVDGGETDWKLLAVDPTDATTGKWRSVDEISAERVNALREWLRDYKTTDGKGQNTFAFDGLPAGPGLALQAVMTTHRHWEALWSQRRQCNFYLPADDGGG